MLMKLGSTSIDYLIEIVQKGGKVRTGIDIFNKDGVLLLEKNVLIDRINPLLLIKNSGVYSVPINLKYLGGMWDKSGKKLSLTPEIQNSNESKIDGFDGSEDIQKRIKEINILKKEASEKYIKAKDNIKKIIDEIKSSDGEFDIKRVEDTVTDVLNFLTKSDTAFSYVTKEIFSYDDYLYNHSINVCTIGTAILKRFNDYFGEMINNYLSNTPFTEDGSTQNELSFIYYLPEELYDISMGFFLHDVGKVLVPEHILNKKERLSPEEFAIIKSHTFEKGIEILAKNKLSNTTVKNIVHYHHSSVYKGEERCYPENKLPIEIPTYVKICKLADIYDAMTSKRCYKEAFNPIAVVSDLFKKYKNKNRIMQYILHSFVKVVGIHPTGSVVFMKNGQMVYILDSSGPIGVPITDTNGQTLKRSENPIDFSDANLAEDKTVDRRRPLISPKEVYDLLPLYLKETIDFFL